MTQPQHAPPSGDDADRPSLREELAEADAVRDAIAHELRSPLGALCIFGSLLQKQHATALDDDGRALLQRLVDCSQRTTALLDRLALLAGIRTATIAPARFDLDAEVAAAFDEQLLQFEGAPPVLELSALPVVFIDRALMRQVLGILLRNAIQCTSRRPAPRIEVGGGESATEATFFVRDNGIGFDAEQSRRLFLPFGRVHSQVECPGDGLGLAFVRSIVRRHGGRAWAEGVPGAGATFHIALPRAPAQSASAVRPAE